MSPTQFERIDAEPPRDVVHLRLISPTHMRNTDAAKRTGRRQIGVDGIGRQTSVGNIVRAARYVTAGFRVDRPIERVGAYFIKRLDLARDDGAVSFDPGFDLNHRAVP